MQFYKPTKTIREIKKTIPFKITSKKINKIK